MGLHDDESDEELTASITPDVMRFLDGRCFFEKLDDALCPEEPSSAPQSCRSTFEISEAILRLTRQISPISSVFYMLRADVAIAKFCTTFRKPIA
jgi:predicted glycosyl hydrolase (DUF1957 family)